ncbi:MAG: hypothetical protein WBP46_09795 [Thiolinea sp.]
MQRLLISLVILISPATYAAASLESFIDALAIKDSASHTNNGWEDTEKIKGVNWEWPYYESGAHDSQMVGGIKLGTDKNPNIGATTVTVSGARSFITDIEIAINNASEELAAFGTAKTTKIANTCSEQSIEATESALESVEFYKFEKAGYKPLYISQYSSWGAGGSGLTSFRLAYDANDSCPSYLGDSEP